MVFERKLSKHYGYPGICQIFIPLPILRKLNWQPGDRVVIRLVQDHITVKKLLTRESEQPNST